ncbi:MAG TPA: PEP-CTERM sorting domain-containing protein [Vicinamibacterales bacterium]|nr:PEP-CTERM sorting domain-containing protein [Vicinamibacterales bacterium]
MRRTYKVMRILALAVMMAAGVAADGVAAPIVSISPSSQTAMVGDAVSADIVVSGLTDPTGGFYLLLAFDDTILSGDSYVADPDGKLGPDAFDLSFGFVGGTLDLFYSADIDWDAAMLAAAQGTGFKLATVTFLAIASGVSPLTLLDAELSTADGTGLLASQSVNGRVCVGGPCPVPEPGLLVLMATGAAVFAVRRRATRRPV